MLNPNFVLKFDEAALVPKKNPSVMQRMRPFIWGIVAIILIASLIFKESIFGELSGMARVLLIILFVGTLFISTDERIPKPIELWFFDEYFIIYRKHHYYSKRLSRLEYDKLFYKDLSTCEYRTKTQRMNFFGVIEGKWYDYNKDGTIPSQPSYHKTRNTICYFYTMFANPEKIILAIESHSPIKINIVNN